MKTLPPIEANVGSRRKLKRTLGKHSRAFFLRVSSDLIAHLMDSGVAMDASFSKKILREARKKVRTLFISKARKSPEQITADIDDYIAEHIGQWITALNEAVRSTVKHYARAVALEVSANQNRVLLASGFPPNVLREAWTIPIVKGRYISPEAYLMLPKMAEKATDQIVLGYAKGIDKVRNILIESVSKGQDLNALSRALALVDDTERRRSEFDALSISNNFTQQIQIANSRAVGITKGKWVHVAGAYTSRETHMAMNGQIFDLSKGIYDPDVKRKVKPGELRYCRCTFRQVLPDWTVKK